MIPGDNVYGTFAKTGLGSETGEAPKINPVKALPPLGSNGIPRGYSYTEINDTACNTMGRDEKSSEHGTMVRGYSSNFSERNTVAKDGGEALAKVKSSTELRKKIVGYDMN